VRFATVAAAVCLCLLATLRAQSTDVQGTVAAAPAAAIAGTPGTATPASDAAAKHAKRTACLKDAKARKLVGADKTAFLKTCIAAP
jgi:hypothetical protein